MTPRQIELARYALGLPNKMSKSCRNRFFTVGGTMDRRHWCDMVTAGHATRYPMKEDKVSDIFLLTYDGACAALLPGERLCPDDFPEAKENFAMTESKIIDQTVDAVRSDLLLRFEFAIKKCGFTLDGEELSLRDWLHQASEECLDQANYLKRAIIELDRSEGTNVG